MWLYTWMMCIFLFYNVSVGLEIPRFCLYEKYQTVLSWIKGGFSMDLGKSFLHLASISVPWVFDWLYLAQWLFRSYLSRTSQLPRHTKYMISGVKVKICQYCCWGYCQLCPTHQPNLRYHNKSKHELRLHNMFMP